MFEEFAGVVVCLQECLDAFAQSGIITTGFVEVRGSFFASRMLQRGFKDFVLGSVAGAHGLTPCVPYRARSANTAIEAIEATRLR